MRLSELNPRWVGINSGEGLTPIHYGVSFDCPHCRTQRLVVLFRPFIDNDEWAWKVTWAWPGAPDPNTGVQREVKFWARTGETFDDLSLSPSVDASGDGHWHGFITSGEVSCQTIPTPEGEER